MASVAERIRWNRIREKEELQVFIKETKQEFCRNPKEGERQAKLFYCVQRHIHPGITRGELLTMKNYKDQGSQKRRPMDKPKELPRDNLLVEGESGSESVNDSTSWPSLIEYYYVPKSPK